MTWAFAVPAGNLGSTGGIGWPWGFAWIGFIPFLSRSEFHFAPFLADVAVVSATYVAAVLVTARIRHAGPKVAPGIVAVVVLFLFLTPLLRVVDGASPSPETDLFLPNRPTYNTSPPYKGIGGWKQVPSGTTSTLKGVAVVDTNNAWTVGEGGTVLHWDGVRWNAIEIPGLSGAYLWDVWASDDGEVWVVGQEPSTQNSWPFQGIILHFDGDQWSKEVVRTSQRLKGVWGSSNTDVWVVGGDEGLHWDGERWSKVPRPGLKITGTGADSVWCIAQASSLFRWNGSSWSEVRERVPGARHIWSGGDSDLWVAAGSNGIHHFDGSTWTTTATSYHSVLAVWGSAPNDVWAAGGEHIDCSDCGGMLRWNGTEWYRWNTQLDSVIVLDLEGSASNDVWAVGVEGKILHFGGQ